MDKNQKVGGNSASEIRKLEDKIGTPKTGQPNTQARSEQELMEQAKAGKLSRAELEAQMKALRTSQTQTTNSAASTDKTKKKK